MKELYGLKVTFSNFCGYRCKYCFVNVDDTKIIDFHLFQGLTEYYLFQIWDIKRFFFLWWEVMLFFDIFQKYLDFLDQQRVNSQIRIYLVTSWLWMTRERVKVLSKYGVWIGVSIDGPEYIHNQNRIDKKGNSTFTSTMKAISLLNEYYSDINLWYTITVDEKTVTHLFESFLYLSHFDAPRRNVWIAATYTTLWKKENIKYLAKELKKICEFIYLQILQENYYYYNILWFFIIELQNGKEPKQWNLEIHAFPDGHISEMLFVESKWENKTLDPNFVRFGIVLPYAKKMIRAAVSDIRYKTYIETLHHKAIF